MNEEDDPRSIAERAVANVARAEYERGYRDALAKLEGFEAQLTARPARTQAQHRKTFLRMLDAARKWLENGGGW